jgi:hypothetical protein
MAAQNIGAGKPGTAGLAFIGFIVFICSEGSQS